MNSFFKRIFRISLRLRNHFRFVWAGIIGVIIFTCVFLYLFIGGVKDIRSRPPNVIVICIDTLRADHLGCYGYKRDTSPAIDSLAREGVVFEDAYSNSSVRFIPGWNSLRAAAI